MIADIRRIQIHDEKINNLGKTVPTLSNFLQQLNYFNKFLNKLFASFKEFIEKNRSETDDTFIDKLEKFITYFEDTWIKENCHFDRSVWNLFEVYSSRTNNISETYNHAING